MLTVIAIIATTLTRLSALDSAIKADSLDAIADFSVTGSVAYAIPYSKRFCHLLVNDEDAAVDITGAFDVQEPEIGDILHLTGSLVPRGAGHIQPQFDTIKLLGKTKPSSPVEGTATEIMSGRHDFRRAHLVGEVRDVEPSGTDPCWNYLSIIADGEQYYAPIPARGATLKELESLIGSTVRLDGFPDSHNCSYRFLDERRFLVADLAHIQVLAAPAGDLFSIAPSVDTLHRLPSEKIARLGRHKATGRILTLWQKRNALLLLPDGRRAIITFSESPNLKRGETAEIVGYPSTDGFTLRLSRAIGRTLIGEVSKPAVEKAFAENDFRALLTDSFWGKSQLQGHRIQLTGTVADFQRHPSESGQFQLLIAGCLLDVDCSAAEKSPEELEPGCRVSVTGTCVLETENWSSLSDGLQLNGIRLVIDRPDDLEILSRPPWWTPAKLTIIVIVLLILLVAFILWNRTLRRLSEKRGRELFRERSANAMAELKTAERTRLAVELHDSISQILTGAAMQLDAGETGAAKRILASCRRELRCCLWDLRSNTLDTAFFSDAIRETLAPHLSGRKASVDFNIPSSRMSESLRHAALRIIREATANAIRHGHAETVSISGELQGRLLSFTIVDDGRGFDPTRIPGSADGHFGLLGIRERTKAFNGTVEISSSPGNGTEISVTLEEQEFFPGSNPDQTD